MLEKIEEWLGKESVLKIPGFDDAVIGYEEQLGVLVYSKLKVGIIIESKISTESSHEFETEFNSIMSGLELDYFSDDRAILVTDDF